MSDNLPDEPISDPLVDRVIQERYRIERKLGQGGMGAVYLAEHLLLKKRVALKCLHAGLASNPQVVRRFKNEAVAASSIGHPNIVGVTDMGRFDDGTFFMVLEYLDGRDWQHDLDEEGPQPVSQVAHVGIQICDALGAAAAKGIVHRDLKPENIFLIERHGDQSFVKVLDFGISKILDGTGGSTKTGELMGTPYYMAPEQVLGEREVTHLADVYALGVMLFQALSGSVPFDGDGLPQIILKIATESAPNLSERCPHLPSDLAGLVNQMMLKEASARPATFQEVAARLFPFLDESSRLRHREDDPIANLLAGCVPAPSATGGMKSAADSVRSAVGKDTASRSLAGGARVAFEKTMLPESFTDSPLTKGVAKAPELRRRALLVAAVVGAVALGGWFLGHSGDDAGKEAAEELSSATADEHPTAVRVEITTTPPDARLLMDGKPLQNPFDEMLEKDEMPHELEIQRAGYRTEVVPLALTKSQKIAIALVKEPTKPATASAQNDSSSASEPSTGSSGSGEGSDSGSTSGSGSGKAPKPLRDLERGIKKLF